MSETSVAKAVGLVGHRSFIAGALAEELAYWGIDAHVVPKQELGSADLSGFDCVYLVLGRDRPGPEEAAVELDQVRSYASNPLRCRRTVYLSSRRAYVHKAKAEELVASIGGVSVRPPAVFGPGQRIDSGMLIPSLVRTGGAVELTDPNRPTEFIHVRTLAQHLVGLLQPSAYEAATRASTERQRRMFGMVVLTPTQVRDLYLTFMGLDSGRRRSDFLAGVECAETGDIARFGSWDAAADHHVGQCD